MPQDNRRLFTPENRVSPFQLKAKKKPVLVDKKNLRKDGRKFDEIRPAVLELGLFDQAKGSAYYEIGNTKIACCVYGPREVLRKKDFRINGQLYCEFKYISFSCKTRQSHMPSSEERDISNAIQEALESVVLLHKFPKSRVEIFISVIQNDGGVLGAALTCAGAALNNAGIEMYDVVVGCSLRQFGQYTLIDPDAEEEVMYDDEKEGHGRITLGLMPAYNQVVLHVQTGNLSAALLTESFSSLLKNCQKIYPFVKMFTKKHIMLQEKSKS